MPGTDPMLGALGLCRRAGRLLHGYDRVADAIYAGKVYLVMLAADASERTATHMRGVCDGLVPCFTLKLTTDQLRMLTPKPAAVFAVTDENLAHLCEKHLTEIKEEPANGL